MTLTGSLKKLKRETVRLKLRNGLWLPLTCKARAKGLEVDGFSIISNNCWGGTIYESYGMCKASPTVGMFIMPSDFVRFCADVDRYLSESLEFISPEESKWREVLSSNGNWGTYLIGRLGDVELQMLHHHDEATARRKWQSRVDRVDRDRLIFKLNDQNGATEEDLLAFDALPLEHKLVFAAKDHPGVRCCRRIHCPRSCEFIPASWEPFGANRSFNVTEYINGCFGGR